MNTVYGIYKYSHDELAHTKRKSSTAYNKTDEIL